MMLSGGRKGLGSMRFFGASGISGAEALKALLPKEGSHRVTAKGLCSGRL